MKDDELYIDSSITRREENDFPFFRGTERANRVHLLQRKRSIKDEVGEAEESAPDRGKAKAWKCQ